MKNNKWINKVITVSKLTLIVSLTGFVITLLISYPYADHFSLSVQVMTHIMTIIFAAIIKVAIVVLMAATKELCEMTSLDDERTDLCYNPKF